MTSFFVCKNRNDAERLGSASGGIFPVLAERFLKRGGIVYGAAFDDDYRGVNHVRVTNMVDLNRLRGPKYIFSNTGHLFANIKEDLDNRKNVLFSGTPCQVAGLKLFLKTDYPTLLCVDVVCHGVANSKVYNYYLDYLEKKFDSKISFLSFRDKSVSWRTPEIVVKFEDGQELRGKSTNNSFMNGFIHNLYLRESCSKCNYKCFLSKSDITLGDFWGITELKDYPYDDIGTSIVAIHSPKGKSHFDSILCKLKDVREVNESTGYVFNKSYKQASALHPQYSYFLNNYQISDFDSLVFDLLKSETVKMSYCIKLLMGTRHIASIILDMFGLKSFVLYIYNQYLILKDIVYRNTHKKPEVIGVLETLEFIKKNHCSVVRYGDGEFKFVLGQETWFQKTSNQLKRDLTDILLSDNNNIIVCIMPMFGGLGQYEQRERKFWTSFNIINRKRVYKYLNLNKRYYNSFISRCYMPFHDKSIASACFNLWKEIWKDQDLIVVEGAKTCLGVGNDLFDNVKSIKRILAPNTNAFSVINKLYLEVNKYSKSHLVLLALGPTATVLAYRLAEAGYWAIDIGHIDIEYEWFLRGAHDKIAIPNKYVIEAVGGRNVSEIDNPVYRKQIVANIV